MQKLYNQVTSTNKNPSMIEEVFRARSRKELTLDEYNAANAIWVAENLSQYPPVVFPLITPILKNYAEARAMGSRGYDELLGIRLGDWVTAIMRAQNICVSDLDLLVWSLEILQDKKLTDHAEKIEKHLDRYNQVSVFPVHEINAAITTQKYDSIERERSKR